MKLCIVDGNHHGAVAPTQEALNAVESRSELSPSSCYSIISAKRRTRELFASSRKKATKSAVAMPPHPSSPGLDEPPTGFCLAAPPNAGRRLWKPVYDFELPLSEQAHLKFDDYPRLVQGKDIQKLRLSPGSVPPGDIQFCQSSNRETALRLFKHAVQLSDNDLAETKCFAFGTKIGSSGANASKCGCCPKIFGVMREEYNKDKVTALEKWIPLLTELARIACAIWENPAKEESRLLLLSRTLLVVARSKGSGCTFLTRPTTETEGCQISFCLSFLCQLLGYRRSYTQLSEFNSLFVGGVGSNFKSLAKQFNKSVVTQRLIGGELSWPDKVFPLLGKNKIHRPSRAIFRNLVLPSHDTIHGFDLNPESFQKKVVAPAGSFLKTSFIKGGSLIADPVKLEGKISLDSTTHSGVVGVIRVADTLLPLLSSLGDALLNEVGHSGRKHSLAFTEVGEWNGLRQCRTPLGQAPALSSLLGTFLSEEDVAAGGYVRQATDFSTQMKTFLGRNLDTSVEWSLLQMSSLLVTTSNCYQNRGANPRHHSQVPHRVFSSPQLQELEANGAKAFVGTLPLTAEGSYVRVIPEGEKKAGGKLSEGHMVFIPYPNVFWQPATLLRGGGFRTGVNGNPRVEFVFILVPGDDIENVMTRVGNPDKEFLPADDSTHFSTADSTGDFYSQEASTIVKAIGSAA